MHLLPAQPKLHAESMLNEVGLKDRLARYLEVEVAGWRVLGCGWDTTIFEFVPAADCPLLGVSAGRSLALRCYHTANALNNRHREYRVLDRLSAVGFAVPRPFRLEEDPAVLGTPFLIMQRLDGEPLLHRGRFAHAVSVFTLGFLGFVRTQAMLHRLDPALVELEESPRSDSPRQALLHRVLRGIRDRITAAPLPTLEPVLAWAEGKAADFASESASIVHLDYHPMNVMVRLGRVTGVVDWVNVDVGDRHLDAATTSAIISSSAFEHPRWLRKNPVGNSLRKVFGGLYFSLYHAIAPMDLTKFRYYQAVAALHRLSMMGMMHNHGPETMGFRREALADITPSVLVLLSRYLERKSGVRIRPGAGLLSAV